MAYSSAMVNRTNTLLLLTDKPSPGELVCLLVVWKVLTALSEDHSVFSIHVSVDYVASYINPMPLVDCHAVIAVTYHRGTHITTVHDMRVPVMFNTGDVEDLSSEQGSHPDNLSI